MAVSAAAGEPTSIDAPIDTPIEVPAVHLPPEQAPIEVVDLATPAPVEPEPVLPEPEPVLPPTEAVLPDPESLFPTPETVLPPPETVLPPPSESALPIKAALAVYHDTEPRVVFSYDILNDITLIGREDPQRDVFPDLDLAKLEKDGVSARSASREHMRLLRQGNQFFLFIFRGSTGTQVNKNLVAENQYGKRFEIQLGDRIVLGGKVRMKLVEKK
jgi:pSer/pThr/pTyr-binding forkhead associated (FHA) protein